MSRSFDKIYVKNIIEYFMHFSYVSLGPGIVKCYDLRKLFSL